MADFRPKAQPRDRCEMAVKGDQDCACFQAMRRDPDIIDRNRRLNPTEFFSFPVLGMDGFHVFDGLHESMHEAY